MDLNEKLLVNVLDDAERLKSQLKDLEEYKADFEPEEYEKIKNDTLNQLVENAKLLDKISGGGLKATGATEEAKKKLAETISENYNIKELMGTFLASEVFYLRENLQKIINKYSIGKISSDDYQHSLSELLAAIGNVTQLNDQEVKLNEELKKNAIMNKYTVDEGLSKEMVENKIKK